MHGFTMWLSTRMPLEEFERLLETYLAFALSGFLSVRRALGVRVEPAIADTGTGFSPTGRPW